MNFTDITVRFIKEVKWEDLPQPVQHQSKRCLLDSLGALLAGCNTPAAAMVSQFVMEHFRESNGSILGRGVRTSLAGAALANGTAANALDIDDGYRLVKGHPGACTLPPALGAAEATGCSGREFLTALVVGYEVGIRAGLIRHARYPTYHASGSWGAVAGAAAAGRLFELDRDAVCNAMGAAEYHAPIAPMMKGIYTPSMVKDSIGWGCMVAMSSVLLGGNGFTGIRPLFDDTPEASWIMDLGQRYEILNLYFKAYAACRWAQPAVAGALKILREHGLSVENISKIGVATFSEAAALARNHPANTEEAQYNLPFPLAAALIDGDVGPPQVLAPRIHDPEIHALMDKTEVFEERRFTEVFPEKTLAEVFIRTRRGETLRSGTVSAPWEPASGLPSDSELLEKFYRLAAPTIGRRQAGVVESMIWDFDTSGDVEKLVHLCSNGPDSMH